MSDCVNCQCEEIVTGSTACASLTKQNDDRIKMHSLVLRDTTLCDLPEETSKAMYSQWCFNKNITSQLCWLVENGVGGSGNNSDVALIKSVLTKIINNLEASGAWKGGLNGDFVPNRSIATGNINLFSNTVDGDYFIRTNKGKTENDLAGGVN